MTNLIKKLPFIRKYYRLKNNLEYYKNLAQKSMVYYEKYNLIQLENNIKSNISSKIVIGSSVSNHLEGWIHTEQKFFDITNIDHWEKYFGKIKLQAMLSEHVLEHIELDQLKDALKLIYDHLEENGYFRIAVPDGYNASVEYLRKVSPEFPEGKAIGHVNLFNYESLKEILENVGFKVELLEWYSKDGEFKENNWNLSRGVIRRSKKYNNEFKSNNQLSLIVDAIK